MALATLGTLWIAAVALGLLALIRYEMTPGDRRPSSLEWPPASKLRRTPGRSSLVMMAHPQCPCSRASVEELAKILTGCGPSVDASILFVEPPGVPPGYSKSPLCGFAARLPGVTVVTDRAGVEAKLFGARTSGHTLLYGANGKLLFSGGITASRGHQGDNSGRAAIEALLTGRVLPDIAHVVGVVTSENVAAGTPVFGCELNDAPSIQGRGNAL